MATKIQAVCLLTRLKKKKLRKPKLMFSPQRKTITLRVRVVTPRKPNSARRPVVKGFMSSKKKVLAYLHGSGHTVKRHSRVLIRGGGARDLPVVNYSCIRGVYDFEPRKVKKRRSIYGLKKPEELKTHVRRKYRDFV